MWISNCFSTCKNNILAASQGQEANELLQSSKHVQLPYKDNLVEVTSESLFILSIKVYIYICPVLRRAPFYI